MNTDILEAILIWKIKRDLSSRLDKLIVHVPEIAAQFCGIGESIEDNLDNAIAALSIIKDMDDVDISLSISEEVSKCLKKMEDNSKSRLVNK